MLEFHEIFHDANPISYPIFSFLLYDFPPQWREKQRKKSFLMLKLNETMCHDLFIQSSSFSSCLLSRLLLSAIVIIYHSHRVCVYIFHFSRPSPSSFSSSTIIDDDSGKQWRHLENPSDSTENISFKCIALIKLYCFTMRKVVPSTSSHISHSSEIYVVFASIVWFWWTSVTVYYSSK